MQTLNMQTASLQVTLNYSYLWLKAAFEPKAGVWSCQPSEYCSPWWPFFLHLLSLPLCEEACKNLTFSFSTQEMNEDLEPKQYNTHIHIKTNPLFSTHLQRTTPNWVCLGGWIGTAKKYDFSLVVLIKSQEMYIT